MPSSAIIVAAGSSSRMGFDKLTVPLVGIPVLQRTLTAFLNSSLIDEIIVVCPPERWGALACADFHKPVRRVDGGTSRQNSVAKGLDALAPDAAWVAVHDGARPLVRPEDIDRCVHAAASHRAVALARRVTETLKRADADDCCLDSVSRDHLWFMETPQVFAVPLLRDAYAAVTAHHLTVTDEVSAVQAWGTPVRFIEAVHPNPKITCPADLALATAILTAS